MCFYRISFCKEFFNLTYYYSFLVIGLLHLLKTFGHLLYFYSDDTCGVFFRNYVQLLQGSIYIIVIRMSVPQGITAVLNFQSESERANWGINSESINDACCQNNILMVNYPIRYVYALSNDSVPWSHF